MHSLLSYSHTSTWNAADKKVKSYSLLLCNFTVGQLVGGSSFRYKANQLRMVVLRVNIHWNAIHPTTHQLHDAHKVLVRNLIARTELLSLNSSCTTCTWYAATTACLNVYNFPLEPYLPSLSLSWNGRLDGCVITISGPSTFTCSSSGSHLLLPLLLILLLGNATFPGPCCSLSSPFAETYTGYLFHRELQ